MVGKSWIRVTVALVSLFLFSNMEMAWAAGGVPPGGFSRVSDGSCGEVPDGIHHHGGGGPFGFLGGVWHSFTHHWESFAKGLLIGATIAAAITVGILLLPVEIPAAVVIGAAAVGIGVSAFLLSRNWGGMNEDQRWETVGNLVGGFAGGWGAGAAVSAGGGGVTEAAATGLNQPLTEEAAGTAAAAPSGVALPPPAEPPVPAQPPQGMVWNDQQQGWVSRDFVQPKTDAEVKAEILAREEARRQAIIDQIAAERAAKGPDFVSADSQLARFGVRESDWTTYNEVYAEQVSNEGQAWQAGLTSRGSGYSHLLTQDYWTGLSTRIDSIQDPGLRAATIESVLNRIPADQLTVRIIPRVGQGDQLVAQFPVVVNDRGLTQSVQLPLDQDYFFFQGKAYPRPYGTTSKLGEVVPKIAKGARPVIEGQ